MARLSDRLPDLVAIRQHPPTSPAVEVGAAAAGATRSLLGAAAPGDRVGIGVGSRGITGLVELVQGAVRAVREVGAVPVLIPAMGSHGGATADGQLGVLASLGVDPGAWGIEVDARMDTVDLGRSSLNVPLWTAKAALDVDHLVLLNRVKAHTHFDGPIQSGLVKMLIIGLGKQPGAELHHRTATSLGWPAVTRAVAPELASRLPLLGGVALIEGPTEAGHGVVHVEAVRAADLLEVEPKLLERADAEMGRLPVDRIETLVIDRIGKNISGTGLDNNIVGRKTVAHGLDVNSAIRVDAIAVRGLTDATGGNALGLGLADLCHARALARRDPDMTRINALTALDPVAAMVPAVLASDRELLEALLPLAGLPEPESVRLAWIADTLHLDRLLVSPSIATDLEGRDDIEIVGTVGLPFTADGELPLDLVDTIFPV